MRNLPKYLALILLALIYSCSSDDDTPGIVPVPNFTQNRLIIEPGEAVTFTNTSTDGQNYSWDFGDNSTSSTSENPTHTFNTVGTFTVTLTVTSNTGDAAASTSTVTVGNRFAVGLEISQIQVLDDNGDPWDDDGSGPELLLGFFPTGQEEFETFILGQDLNSGDLPVGGSLDASSQVMLTNADWTFVFLDNDEPFTDPNTSDVMTVFNLNPVTIASQKDYQTGEGQFEFVSSDGYTILIAFDIK